MRSVIPCCFRIHQSLIRTDVLVHGNVLQEELTVLISVSIPSCPHRSGIQKECSGALSRWHPFCDHPSTFSTIQVIHPPMHPLWFSRKDDKTIGQAGHLRR